MSRRHTFVALLLGAMSISLVGCNSGGTSTTSPIDLSPPQAPTNLHTSSDARINRDWLVWDPSASANVADYEIYSGPSNGVATLVATVDASTSNYILPTVSQNSTEHYRIRAVGSNSVPSAFTANVDVDRTATVVTTSTPSAPVRNRL